MLSETDDDVYCTIDFIKLKILYCLLLQKNLRETKFRFPVVFLGNDVDQTHKMTGTGNIAGYTKGGAWGGSAVDS